VIAIKFSRSGEEAIAPELDLPPEIDATRPSGLADVVALQRRRQARLSAGDEQPGLRGKPEKLLALPGRLAG
jgi:hypothetical protein